MRKKESRRDLYDIGVSMFAFDIEKEKQIYKNLACYKLDGRSKKKLINEQKFTSYKMWKKYIIDKYSSYPVEGLEEFKRYLNQKTRRAQSFNSNWKIFIPVLSTLIFNEFARIYIDTIINTQFDYSVNPLKVFMVEWIFYILITAIVFGTAYYLINKMVKPTLDNEIENNLLIDYKEIIEYMIEEKNDNE